VHQHNPSGGFPVNRTESNEIIPTAVTIAETSSSGSTNVDSTQATNGSITSAEDASIGETGTEIHRPTVNAEHENLNDFVARAQANLGFVSNEAEKAAELALSVARAAMDIVSRQTNANEISRKIDQRFTEVISAIEDGFFHGSIPHNFFRSFSISSLLMYTLTEFSTLPSSQSHSCRTIQPFSTFSMFILVDIFISSGAISSP
jgi:hypothetical protein